MKFLSILFSLQLLKIILVANGQVQCSSTTDCNAFLLGQCSSGTCNHPSNTADCDYLGAEATMITIYSSPPESVCTKTCSTNSDCSALPTAKICSTHCRECQNGADCTAMGFQNHRCDTTSGFCYYLSAINACIPGSTYCGSANNYPCLDDSARCWLECVNSDDCRNSRCQVGATENFPYGACSDYTNIPPSISSPCTSSSQCLSASAPICLGGSCTSCSLDSDCDGLYMTHYCNSGTCGLCKAINYAGCGTLSAAKCDDISFTCIACASDDDCGHFFGDPYCNLGTCGSCSVANNAGCSSVSTAKCSSGASCVACSADSHCTHLTSTPYCNSGICGACSVTSNAGCLSPSTAKCSSGYFCVACSGDSDCSHLSSTPYCNSGACGSCRVSDDTGCVSTSTKPYCNSNGCGACKSSSNKGCSSPSAARCDTGSLTCATCSTDSDCSHLSSTPYCNSGICGACRDSDYVGCSLTNAAKCSSGSCVACSGDTDCANLSPNLFCNSGICGQCRVSDSVGCTLATEAKCSSSSFTCLPCSADSDCTHLTATPYCNSGACGACRVSDYMGCASPTSAKCLSGSCNACSVDGDCTHLSSTSYCNSGICGACKVSNNNGCSSVSAAKCSTSTFTCTVCSANSDCVYLASTPYCSSGTCGACAVINNAGCLSVSAARCNPVSLTCTTCSADNDCTHLSSTPYCSSGICQTCELGSDTGCGSPTPFCKSIAGTNTCVQCLSSADCHSSTPLCSLSSNKCIGESAANLTMSSSSQRDFIISFSQNISVLPADCQFFYIQIQNLTYPQNFSFTWSRINSHTLTFTLSYYGDVEINKNNMQVLFNSSAISTASNFIVPGNLSYVLPAFVPLSDNSKSSLSSVITGAKVLIAATVAIAIPSVFASGPLSTLWNFVGICQIVNYLLYLLVVWPEDAQMIFNLFSYASFNFIPNPFQNIVDNLNALGSVTVIPDNFADNGATGLFIGSSGSTVMTWGLVLLFYLITKVSGYFLRNSTSKFASLVKYFHDNFEYRGVIRSVSSSFLTLGLNASLQLYTPSSANWAVGLSSALSALFAYFLFLYIVVCCWIIYSRPGGENRQYDKKFGPIFEDYKTENRFQRSFEIFLLIRKSTYIGFLLGFSSNAIAQVALVSINSFVTFGTMVLVKPYKEKKDLLQNAISEGVISCIMVCALVLLNDQTSQAWMTYSDKLIVGWVVVGLCGVLILANIIFLFYDSYQKYREWYLKCKRRREERKIKREASLTLQRIRSTRSSNHRGRSQIDLLTSNQSNISISKDSRKRSDNHSLNESSEQLREEPKMHSEIIQKKDKIRKPHISIPRNVSTHNGFTMSSKSKKKASHRNLESKNASEMSPIEQPSLLPELQSENNRSDFPIRIIHKKRKTEEHAQNRILKLKIKT